MNNSDTIKPMPMQNCPFCRENDMLKVAVRYEGEQWYVTEMKEGSIQNAVMAMQRRHVETPFDLNESEWRELKNVIAVMKSLVDNTEKPQGYNLGWNIEKTGGQNVPHVHLHLFARYNDEPLAGKGLRYIFKQPNNARKQ